MAINNNYGCKILGQDGVSLNGNWPIFGFDVQNSAQAFRTTRVVDSSTNSFYNSGIVAPTDAELFNGTGQTIKSGVVKKLITRYKHGYDYAPSGYYTISGSLSIDAQATVVQSGSGTYYTEFYGGDYTRNGTRDLNISGTTDPIYPRINGSYYYDEGLSMGNYMIGISYGTNSALNPDIVVPGGTQGNPFVWFANNTVVDYDGVGAFITVEIDSTYVNIYMNYRWYDTIFRKAYFDGVSLDKTIYDVTNRVRLVAQTTGSVFNVNVYLTPHKLEEMIING